MGIVIDLPGFLTGALAVHISDELAFGTVGLGIAVAAVRGAAAASSLSVGLLADRLGAIHTLRLAAAIALVSATGIALTATSWLLLTFWLAISGCAIAFGHAGANRLLSRTVPANRQGAAFGMKQSAPPAAALLAGLSVSAIAVTVGWRWAFGIAAMTAAAMILAVGKRPGVRRAHRGLKQPRSRLDSHRAIVFLSGAFFFGTAAAVATPAFYVDAAARAGSTPEFAGTLLAVASAATILTRLTSGFVADRLASRHLWLCCGLLAAGAAGFILLSTGQPALMAVGAVIAMANTWGYNGVFWFAVVRAYHDAPGRITGVIGPGGHLGGTLGPLLIGFLADVRGYSTAWVVCGAFSIVAAILMLIGERSLPAPPGRSPPDRT